MKKYDLSIIGEVTLDDVFVNGVIQSSDGLGGDGLYALSGANMFLENKGALFVRKGNDLDINTLKELTKERIDYSYCKEIDKYNIHLFCLFDRKGNRYFITQMWGGNDDDFAPRVGDISDEFLNGCKALHIAPFIIEYSKDCITELLNRKPEDLIISVDPHYDGLGKEHKDFWFKALSKIDVFLPSELELKSLFDIDKCDDYTPYIKKICEYGPRVCCVKLGEDGCLGYDKQTDKLYRIPVYNKCNVVDVTGCGDTFCGGFMASYIKDQDLYKAMIAGSVASSFTIEHYGVLDNYKLDKHQIDNRLKEFSEYLKENKYE